MRYIVKLKNRTFEVEVEAGAAVLLNEYEDGKPLSGKLEPAEKSEAAQPTPAPKLAAVPVAPPVKPAPAAEAAGGNIVRSPMPGMITEILVSEGQTVADGDTLMILEAMKMENEIVATCDGTVSRLCVSKGQVVQTDDPLAEIR